MTNSPSVRFVAIQLAAALMLLLTVHPARAFEWWVMLADGCHSQRDLPVHLLSPDALQRWLEQRGEQVKRDEAHFSDGSVHHILIATPDSLVAGFFQRLPICKASFPLHAKEFRPERLLPLSDYAAGRGRAPRASCAFWCKGCSRLGDQTFGRDTLSENGRGVGTRPRYASGGPRVLGAARHPRSTGHW
jgi:hypothetical protein